MEFQPAEVLVGALATLFGIWLIWLWTVGRKQARHDREWTSDCAKLAHVTWQDDDSFTLHNRRDFIWRTVKDHDERWDEWQAKVSDCSGIWVVLDHFHKIRGMAHTLLIFEFGEQFLTVSFEARREKGESYHPWSGLWREFEMQMVLGTERDLLGLRTHVRGNDVYLYECEVLPHKRHALLRGVLARANAIHGAPEWYNTLTKTCATSLVQLVNRVTPGRIPITWRSLVPGYAHRTVHQRGILVDRGGLAATMAAARLTPERVESVDISGEDPNLFSKEIRAHLTQD